MRFLNYAAQWGAEGRMISSETTRLIYIPRFEASSKSIRTALHYLVYAGILVVSFRKGPIASADASRFLRPNEIERATLAISSEALGRSKGVSLCPATALAFLSICLKWRQRRRPTNVKPTEETTLDITYSTYQLYGFGSLMDGFGLNFERCISRWCTPKKYRPD